MRRFWLILPPVGLAFMLVLIVLPYLVQPLVAIWADAEAVFLVATLQVIVPGVCVVGYGVYRALHFHPRQNGAYGRWLATTPWSYGKPLPLGPVHLVWEDAVVVTVLAIAGVLGILNVQRVDHLGSISPAQTLTAVGIIAVGMTGLFYVTYLGLMIMVTAGAKRILTAILFLIPLIVYPHGNLWAGLAVVAAISGLTWFALRETLRVFPYDNPDWTRDARDLLLANVRRLGLIGWPHRQIGPSRVTTEAGGTLRSVVVSLMVGWWAFALPMGGMILLGRRAGVDIATIAENLRDADSDGPVVLWLLWFFVVILLTGARGYDYLRDTLPPISLLGRIRTGRLVIPGYDKVLFGPLLMLVFGWFAPGLWVGVGVPPMMVPAFCLTGLLLMATLIGPTKEAWRHTGLYRARAWAPPTQPTRQNRESVTLAGAQINLTGPSR